MGKTNSRNITIDILRVIATFLVILAHVDSPKIINDIRFFDVVALVLISGMVIRPINSFEEYKHYLVGRVKRLIIPTWILLSILFISVFLICVVTKNTYIYSLRDIILSYMLIDGIGYVWVVRVFLLIAIMAPVILRINRKIKNHLIFLLVIFLLCITNYLSYKLMSDNIIVKYVFLYLIPYSIIAMIGCRVRLYKDSLNIILIISLISYLLVEIYTWRIKEETIFNFVKYPPLLKYCLYGITVSLILYKAIDYLKNKKTVFDKEIKWLSKNSFSIYLAHIPCMVLLENIIYNVYPYMVGKWLLNYFVVCLTSLSIVYIYEYFVNRFKRIKF